MGKKYRVCVLCGNKLPVGNFGNTPEPIKPFSSGVCCDECYRTKVIPTRLAQAARTDKGIGVPNE